MEGLINGRMVHYVDNTGYHEACVIIDVSTKIDGMVNLFVFSWKPYDNILYNIKYNENKEEDTWHWIEKE